MLSINPYELPGPLAGNPSANSAEPMGTRTYNYDAVHDIAANYDYDAKDVSEKHDSPSALYCYDYMATLTRAASPCTKRARQRSTSITPRSHKHRRPHYNQSLYHPRTALWAYHYDARNHLQTGDDAIQSTIQPTPSDQSATRPIVPHAAEATVTLQYNYGPFGEVIRMTGVMAKANPFRFSTKYTDDESDLVYYGYRYYNPSTGRWLNRDPIQEYGGINLFEFVKNNPVTHVDPDGRIVGYVFALVAGRCGLPYYFAAHWKFPNEKDKLKHCWTTCMIAKDCGSTLAAGAGLVKEARDLLFGGSWEDSKGDMAANVAGLKCAPSGLIPCPLYRIPVSALVGDSCESCCHKSGY